MSPWTVHFQQFLSDKSPVLGPGRGPPSCNTSVQAFVFSSLTARAALCPSQPPPLPMLDMHHFLLILPSPLEWRPHDHRQDFFYSKLCPQGLHTVRARWIDEPGVCYRLMRSSNLRGPCRQHWGWIPEDTPSYFLRIERLYGNSRHCHGHLGSKTQAGDLTSIQKSVGQGNRLTSITTCEPSPH